MSSRAALVALVSVLIIGLGVRSYGLGQRSLWFDEGVSVTSISDFSWTDMVDRTGQAVHPPLYYIVLRLWSLCVGTSVVALRSFSVLMAGATMVGVYLLCRDGYAADSGPPEERLRGSRPIGVLAAALVAASAYHIAWSQQARMYMFGTAMAAASTWTLIRAVRSEQPVKWWIGYVFAASAFLYTHHFAIFSLSAQICFASGYLLWTHRRNWIEFFRSRSFWGMVGALVAIAVIYVPWVPVLMGQSRRVRQDYWISPIHAWTTPNAWFELFYPKNEYGRPERLPVIMLIAVVAGVLAWCLRRGRLADWLLVLLVVVPVFGAVAVSLISSSIVIPRYFIFAHLFALCAIASVAWRAFSGLLRQLVVCTLFFAAIGVHLHYRSELRVAERPGLRGAVEYVLAQRRADEPLIVVHPSIFHSVKYYTRGVAEPKLYLQSALSHYNGGPLLTPGDVIQADDLAKITSPRVWVIDTTGFSGTFARFSLPHDWRPIAETDRSFEEVEFFQRCIVVAEYINPSAKDGTVLSGPLP